MFFVPKVLIDEPLAALRLEVERIFFCIDDAGKTETSAPLSTRKARRRCRQKTESAPSCWDREAEEEVTDETVGEVPGAIGPRLFRFPRQVSVAEDEGYCASCK